MELVADIFINRPIDRMKYNFSTNISWYFHKSLIHKTILLIESVSRDKPNCLIRTFQQIQTLPFLYPVTACFFVFSFFSHAKHFKLKYINFGL